MSKTVKYFMVSAFMLVTIAVSAQKNSSVVGTWLTQEGKSKVVITQNNDGSFDGEITWLKEPFEEDGSEKLDKHNPEEKLQSRKILGLKLLEGFTYDEDDNEWTDGTIYDPKSGSTYKCYMWFDGNNDELQVKGYIGFSLIGRKVSWTRIKTSS